VAGLFDIPDVDPPTPTLVPAPEWLRYRVSLEGEPLFLRSGELLAHRRTLDLRRGVLLTDWDHRDPKGRTMRLRSLRLVSLANRGLGLHLAQIDVDQPVEVTLDAWVELLGAGLEPVRSAKHLAVWRTARLGHRLAIASAGAVHADGTTIRPQVDGYLKRTWSWVATPAKPAIFWRLVAFERGEPRSDPGEAARRALSHARGIGWPGVVARHAEAWALRWETADIAIEGDDEAQRALRFAIYHLISAANPDDDRVSIGPRGLTGDAYLGHVFWDTEIFLLPFYSLTWPEAARALLMYRYHTLPAARAKAAQLGYRGALYAWESADTGEETTPTHVIGFDGLVVPILCGTQEQHISADVAYAVWHYWEATHDSAFLLNAGAEIILETARFWASRARLEQDGWFHIREVIGPDEYHESVDDNAFTNHLAAWNLERGIQVVELLRERWPGSWKDLAAHLELTEAEIEGWQSTASAMYASLDSSTGVFEQFAGYFNLEPIDLSAYEGRKVPMDVVLGPERTRGSQVVKQADVVMLLALLSERFDRSTCEANFNYYEPRCGHGSSLSRGMHAVVAARLGHMTLAERYFLDTAAIDLEDTTGTGAGGVHMAALGGLWQAAVFGFAGLSFREDGLALDPHIPDSWHVMSFRVQWRDRQVYLRLERASRLITARLERGEPLSLHVGGDEQMLQPWESWSTNWPDAMPRFDAN
jgi:trehalose/maltose hydrolase-like predicted phosphorylase